MFTPTFATVACLPRSYPSNGQLPPADLFAGPSYELNPAHEFFWPVARGAQRTSFSVVASCGLLPRTTRPGPRLRTAFWSVASLPLRDTRESWTWSVPITECSVILSEASLRAQSKDPRPKRSRRRVADPSQAQDDIQPGAHTGLGCRRWRRNG